METNVVKERLAFVHDWESGHWSITELCERYGVSRPTGYKWLARHEVGGRAGLRIAPPRRWKGGLSTPDESTAGARRSCYASCGRGTRVTRGRRAVR